MEQQWVKLVARTEAILHWDACVSFRRAGLSLGPIRWGTRRDLVLKNNSPLGIWYDGNPPITEQTNLVDLAESVQPAVDHAIDKAVLLIDQDLALLPGNTFHDLEDLYRHFRTDMGLMVFGLVCNFPLIERLEEVIGSQRFQEHRERLLRPHKATLIGRESRRIYEIQQELAAKDSAWLEDQAARLAQEFGFIHGEYVSQSWSKDDYLRALRGEVLAIEDIAPWNPAQFNDYETWLIGIIQKLSYLHDEGKTALVRANWALRMTLQTLGYDDSLLRLTEKEFFQFVATRSLPPDLDNREHSYAILSLGDRYEYYFGHAAVERLTRQQGLLQDAVMETQLQGTVAFAGKVYGKARVIYSQEDSKALEVGEVLIASMTTPAYIDAMRRAAAFVTDEGGMLCHAAIVSREFRKPCVVGTKVATSSIETGDLVEVDANEGVVKIIERA